ncbi:hypothetical protein P280DRAFT_405897 [Massarina eburnea CBS 473.64]|uniref:Uncharacterized protein n=1 Tax=Massarina eburnea CBS 473.64 TaxID=1395130 RepID=A0A6A6RRM8_9PLEO|nr:hypothetical protein P280DRAFT_405897 [Massarina eburnea CBS 473.64]
MPPKAVTKRPLEDAEDAPAVKRGRGRPAKDASAPPPQDPSAEAEAPKRGRGRPPKDPNTSTPAKSPKVPGRGRGRPKNVASSLPDQPTPGRGRRGRGRPKKNTTTEETSTDPLSPVPATTKVVAKKGRGRPKKSDTTPNAPATSSSTTNIKLSSLIGTYGLNCPEVEGSWPERSDDMALFISALPHTKSTLIASFDLGIVEGTMLIAGDEETLARSLLRMKKDDPEPDKAADPILKGHSVFFSWRGRGDGDENTIWPGTYGDQTGSLKFDNKCLNFDGVGSFPAMGDKCAFRGEKVDNEPDQKPEPWNSFSEKAAEKANRARWG